MSMMISPYMLAAAGGSGYTQWRMLNDNYWNNSLQYCGLAEMEMHTAAGGSDVCTGGTASASSIYSAGYEAAKAFDDNTSTIWHSAGEANSWLQYTFAAAVNIVEIKITSRPSENSVAPRTMFIQYYDGSTWQTSWTIGSHDSPIAAWGSLETRTFTKP